MTETPPPRRALATFLRRPAAKDPPPVDTQAASATPEAPEAEADTHAETQASAEAAVPTQVTQVSAAPAEDTPPATPPAQDTIETAPTAEAEALADATGHDVAEPPPADVPAAAWRAAELPVASAAAPTFARTRVRAVAPRTPAWQWALLVLLGLLLALQILLADRARLAADARWRPLLTTLCGALRCELPLWHEPGAFTMLDRDVRPSAGETGVLRIQASFRNDARWNQAWPWLQLSLSDADGRMIGSRVFSPAEYLGHAPDPAQTLAPGQSGRIDFRVREPAAGTAAFTFDFH